MIKKVENEKKLLRNIDNIVNKYLKVDDKLLEAIIKEDDVATKELLGSNSADNFFEFRIAIILFPNYSPK